MVSNGESQLPEEGTLSPDCRHYWNGPVWKWQPLWLTPDAVLDAVRRYFDRPATSATYLASGALNQSWRVDDHVLRVSRPEQDHVQIAYEHEVVRRLAQVLDVVPAPVPGRDGNTIQWYGGRLLSLFPYVPGPLGAEVERSRFVVPAAETLGRIHRAAHQLSTQQRPGWRPFTERPRHPWRRIGPILRREISGEEAGDLFAVVDRAAAEADEWFDKLPDDRLAIGLIHGDFNSRNLILDGDRIAAVIDWDGSRVDPYAIDIVGLVLDASDPAVVWKAYLDAGGPMSRRDFDLLPAFGRLGALSELQWTVDDGHAKPNSLPILRNIVGSFEPLD